MTSTGFAAILVGSLLAQHLRPEPVIWEKGTIAIHDGVDVLRPALVPSVPGVPPVTAKHHFLMRDTVFWGKSYLPSDDLPGIERKATCYHHADGPVGLILERFDWFQSKPRREGAGDLRMPASLVGLGFGMTPTLGMLGHSWSEPPLAESTMSAGTVAAYGHPFQTIRFFEEDERAFEINDPAKGEPLLTHIRDARRRGTNVELFKGPRRPTFEKQACEDFYAAIFVEACPRDRLEDICVEWMTREGMASLAKSLRPDGAIAYHTSNRYMVMLPPIMDVAESLGLKSLCISDVPPYDRKDPAHFGSEWVVVARSSKTLDALRAAVKARAPARPGRAFPEGISIRERPVSVERPPADDFKVDAKYVWTDKGPNSIDGLFRTSPILSRKEGTARNGDPAAVIYLTIVRAIPEPEKFFLAEWHRTNPNSAALRNEPTDRIDRERVAEWTRRYWDQKKAAPK